MSQELEVNSVLLNKYRIESKLGQGGFGAVYLATDIALGRKVAIKTISPRHSLSNTPDNYSVFAEYLERFQREAMVSAFFTQNRNIIVVYGLERQTDSYYLVLEYLEGGSLSQLLKEPISIERACAITLDICNALRDIHAHSAEIVHRDLKPANILLRPNGEAVVADFGIAQVGQLSERTNSPSTHPGSPAYRSPEQANQFYYLTPASDLYSLGLILYEMLTGKLYARVKTLPPSELNPAIPAWLDKLVIKLLQKNPTERYQTANEVSAVIRQHQNSLNDKTSIAQNNFGFSNDEVTLPVETTAKPDGGEPTTILHDRTQAGPTFELGTPTVLASFPTTTASQAALAKKPAGQIWWIAGAVAGLILTLTLIFLVLSSSNNNSGQNLGQVATATVLPATTQAPFTPTAVPTTVPVATTAPTRQPTAIPTATVAEMSEKLIDFVKEVDENKRLILGPRSATLTQQPNGAAAIYSTNADFTNFVIEAKFYNAVSPVVGRAQDWDYGFFFRLTDTKFYYLYVTPKRHWNLVAQEDINGRTKFDIIAEGEAPRLDVTEAGVNKLRLLVSGNQGVFYINENFVSELKLDKITEAGSVGVGTGITKNTINGTYSPNIVNYENLLIYELD